MISPLKLLFFVTDILMLVFGIVVVSVGTIVLKDERIAAAQLGNTATYWFHKSAYLIMVFGFVLMFFAILGLWAVLAKSMFMLCCFSICCIIPLIMVIVALGIAWYFLTSPKIGPVVAAQLRKYWLSRDAFKGIEISYMCCGIEGPGDYNGSIPASCIDEEGTKSLRSTTVITERFDEKTLVTTRSPVVTRVPTVKTRVPTAKTRVPTVKTRVPTSKTRVPTVKTRVPTAKTRVTTAKTRVLTVRTRGATVRTFITDTPRTLATDRLGYSTTVRDKTHKNTTITVKVDTHKTIAAKTNKTTAKEIEYVKVITDWDEETGWPNPKLYPTISTELTKTTAAYKEQFYSSTLGSTQSINFTQSTAAVTSRNSSENKDTTAHVYRKVYGQNEKIVAIKLNRRTRIPDKRNMNILALSKKYVYHQTGCLDRVREMLTTMTSVLSGLYTTILLLMIISFILALLLRKRSQIKMA